MYAAQQTDAFRPLLRRVSRQDPCPICAHADWCEIREDGAVHCMRVEGGTPSDYRGGGWWYFPEQVPTRVSSPPAGGTNVLASVPVPPADPAVLDQVYRALLNTCPPSAAHVSYLSKEGIAGDQLQGYGSLHHRRVEIANHLQRRVSNDILATVPGLYLRADGMIAVASPDGLLVAVKDAEGRIIGMQCRIEEGGKKRYLWLSSAARGGASSGSPAHVCIGSDTTTTWVTEGAKKAHVASLHLGQTVVGLSGHNSIAAGLAALDTLQSRGALCIVIALDQDSDPAVAARVEESRCALVEACLNKGFAVRIARWEPGQGKGLDDVLRAGHTPIIEVALQAVASPNRISKGGSPHTCSCPESTDFRIVKKILEGPLPDTEKLAVIGLSLSLGSNKEEKQHVYMDSVVQAAGLTSTRSPETARKRAGQALLTAAEYGIIHRDASDRDPSNDHIRLQFALNPALLPLPGVQLPVPTRVAKDRARKLCTSCGSSLLQIKCLCCGVIQVDALERTVKAGDPVQIVDQAPKTPNSVTASVHNLYSDTLNFRNPEVGSTLLPDSRRRIPNQMRDADTPLADPDFLLSNLDKVLAALRFEPQMPRDYLTLRTGLEFSEVREALQLGLRLRKIVESAPTSKNGALCYSAAGFLTPPVTLVNNQA